MDNIKHLLTNFDGRIGRQQFWIGIGVMVVGAIILSLLLGATIGPRFGGLIMSLAILYPVAALYSKRLHDRSKETMPWLAIFLGPSIIANIFLALGIGYKSTVVAGQTVMMPGMLGGILSLATLAVGIWALVELGCLRGTVGQNSHGEDPVSDTGSGHSTD